MRFLPSAPEGSDRPYLPARKVSIPTGTYINPEADSLASMLIPYEAPQRLDVLPKSAANFELLAQSKLPFIIAPRGSLQKPRINAQMAVLLRNLNDIHSWIDMLIAIHVLPGLGGQIARLQVVDRHNDRYIVLDAHLDPGEETGVLVLKPMGRKGRSGKNLTVDPESLIDYRSRPPLPFGLPVLLYKSRRNPWEPPKPPPPAPIARDFEGGRLTADQIYEIHKLFAKIETKVYSQSFIKELYMMGYEKFKKALQEGKDEIAASVGSEVQVLNHVLNVAFKGLAKPDPKHLEYLDYVENLVEDSVKPEEKIEEPQPEISEEIDEVGFVEDELSFLDPGLRRDIEPVSSDPQIADLQRSLRRLVLNLREEQEDHEPITVIRSTQKKIRKTHEQLMSLLGR